MLERVGFFDKCGKEWLFRTLDDATKHATDGAKLVCGIWHCSNNLFYYF